MLLLTTTGAKSGQRRITPLGYQRDGDNLIVFASMLGAPTNPAWYHNLVAHPDVTIEIGGETFDGTATVTSGSERTQLWERAVKLWPFLSEHQAKTARQIPVITLSRRAS